MLAAAQLWVSEYDALSPAQQAVIADKPCRTPLIHAATSARPLPPLPPFLLPQAPTPGVGASTPTPPNSFAPSQAPPPPTPPASSQSYHFAPRRQRRRLISPAATNTAVCSSSASRDAAAAVCSIAGSAATDSAAAAGAACRRSRLYLAFRRRRMLVWNAEDDPDGSSACPTPISVPNAEQLRQQHADAADGHRRTGEDCSAWAGGAGAARAAAAGGAPTTRGDKRDAGRLDRPTARLPRRSPPLAPLARAAAAVEAAAAARCGRRA